MTKRSLWAAGMTVLTLVAWSGASRADVTVERVIRSSGLQGIAAGESTVVEKLSGSKKREVSAHKLTGSLGGLLSKLSGETGSDAITDLDKGVIWQLDLKKKTYTEVPLEGSKEDLRALEKGSGSDASRRDEKPEVRVVRNEVSAKDTGEKKTINGFDCTRYVVTWTLETEDVKTKERATTTMTTDLWNTPETKETRALAKEEAAFNEAYMKKLGLDLSAAEAKKFGLAAASAFVGGDAQQMKAGLAKIEREMAKVKGFPIATTVRWESAGAGQKPDAKQPAPKEAEEALGLGGLFSKLSKKMAGGGGAAQEPKTGAFFESYTEIRRIDLSPVGRSDFEVPAGFSKQ